MNNPSKTTLPLINTDHTDQKRRNQRSHYGGTEQDWLIPLRFLRSSVFQRFWVTAAGVSISPVPHYHVMRRSSPRRDVYQSRISKGSESACYNAPSRAVDA